MTTSLTSVIDQPPSGRTRAVLLDSHDYAQAVLLQGRPVPWLEPMAYSNFFGQAQALVKSDVALLSLDRLYDHHLKGNLDLQSAMSAKSRTGYALRTLLADSALLSQVTEFATTFSKTQRAPIVLQIPSPMQWLARTHHFSGTTDVSGLDADNGENASMYVADWLRSFAALPLAGVLLDDRTLPGAPDTTLVPLETYSPIANVTEHYQWTLALRTSCGIDVHGASASGAIIRPGFWLDNDQVLPDGDFLLGEIPSGAVPEEVLTRILALT
ncbi:hypothetical protein [Cryobacterium psychrophilum]|uniref:Uncharacterized protein n=1 Tax=Cryobacterium psychrophilum TaxID=41988 RepID=A0A4Y8KQE2_9MICO|nr:hypothetical protein [Cryobacterium psychrophilum]TDW30856.1 hypothetical protein EDD25_2634 [Cryobacterium psychrophilum]TFD75754.1 hypothetical protein E3T53_14840 [Cryobacterium psychrophilum]